MNKQQIVKLVGLTFVHGEIDENVAIYVLQKLNKNELKIYSRYLKNEIEKNKVIITTSEKLSTEDTKKFKDFFPGKNVFFETDAALGGGIKVKTQNDIIDLSIKNYIDNTINSVKNDL